ncbi:MAG: YciI family protein [Pseudomonadales bacterium]|nr:YciI family protein [Pseudomonadales bacterium]
MSNMQTQVDALKDKMLQKSYYVMTRQMLDPSKLAPVMLEHYQWMIKLEQDNRVFASGPMFKEDGSKGVGLTIFRVESFEEARCFAKQDPFVTSGAVDFELQRWQLNEGRINVAINFSDQTYNFS